MKVDDLSGNFPSFPANARTGSFNWLSARAIAEEAAELLSLVVDRESDGHISEYRPKNLRDSFDSVARALLT
jgi:hypothetical protein